MASATKLSIVNVGYRSTNYWVVSNGVSRILFDVGWPGLFGTLKANIERMDIKLREIKYALASHYHIDHAGAAQELKQAGVPLLVMETQTAWVPRMKRWTKPQDNYLEITPNGNVEITFSESRAFLGRIGIAGQIIPTPGHSDDSVSLVLDDGSAFTGDLTRPEFISVENAEQVHASWARLREAGARVVYPGHGPAYEMTMEDG